MAGQPAPPPPPERTRQRQRLNNALLRGNQWLYNNSWTYTTTSSATLPFSVLIAEDRKEFGTNDDTHAKGMGLIIVLITVLVGGILARPLAWKVLHAIPMKNVRTKTWILIWIYWNHPKNSEFPLKVTSALTRPFPVQTKNIYIHLGKFAFAAIFLWWKVGESAE